MNKNRAFTLIELMAVVVIVGIISTIAVVAYKKYIIDAKMAEAYQGIEALLKSELAYYYEHDLAKEFMTLDTPNPATLDPAMVIANSSGWYGFFPAALGSQVLFSYHVGTGKTDGTGAELTVSPVTGTTLFTTSSAHDYTKRTFAAGGTCNPTYSALDFGASPQANYTWIIVSAVGDLNGDNGSLCSSVSRLTDISDGSQQSPSSKGYVTMNKGE